MNAMQQGVVTLLRSAITGEVLPLPEDFDIEAAYPVVRAHQIATTIYEAAARCGISQQHPAMQKLFQHYCKSLQVSGRQLRSLEQICSAFSAAGIDYMLLKGSILKKLYPKPEMRMMGDADVLIRLEQYEAIVPVMEQLGFQLMKETGHELTWVSGALEVELHKSLFPPAADDFHAYYGDGWSMAKRAEGSQHVMSAEDSYIFIFTHFVKHFRSSGIGCRQVMDLWVYRRANPDMDEAYIISVLEKIHLRAFYENMLRTISAWFEDGAEDDQVQLITDVIFSSGSWGSTRTRTLAAGVRDAKRSGRRFKGKTAYVLRRIFPGVDSLRMRYPVLKKAPYLLPGVWLYFLVSKSLFTKGAWHRHMDNLSALTRENVETHSQMLRFVGLDDQGEDMSV